MKLTKQLILLLAIPLLLSFSPHIETVITYNIHTSENSLKLSATMEKNYASILVMLKGNNVAPSNRGVELNRIIRENTSLVINDTAYKLSFKEAAVQRKNIVLTYTIDAIPEKIESLTMNNDVIVGFDDEAIVNAFVHLEHKEKKVLRFDKQIKTRTLRFKTQ